MCEVDKRKASRLTYTRVLNKKKCRFLFLLYLLLYYFTCSPFSLRLEKGDPLLAFFLCIFPNFPSCYLPRSFFGYVAIEKNTDKKLFKTFSTCSL